jgi:hypothetical protein
MENVAVEEPQSKPPPAKAKAKVKAKSKPKAKASVKAKAKSDQGQGGSPISLDVDRMNKNELKIVKGIFSPKGERPAHTIKTLQSMITKSTKSTSPARNALRRLVRAGWLEKTEIKLAKDKKRKAYRLTEKARKRGIS